MANGSYSSGSAQVSPCGDFSQSLGARGLSNRGSQALEHRLNSCGAGGLLLRGMWDLPASGIEPGCLLHRQADSLPLGASKEALKYCFLEAENVTSRYNMSTLFKKKKVSKWKNIILKRVERIINVIVVHKRKYSLLVD